MTVPLPVTVVTGATSPNRGVPLLTRLLRGASDRVVAIVPRRSRKPQVGNDVTLIPTTERLIRMGAGCSCCTVRGDLNSKIRRIATTQATDHILIHAAPHEDLVTLAKTFTVADSSGSVLADFARVGTMAATVDAPTFLETLQQSAGRQLIQQIELANVILLTETDALTETTQQVIRAVLQTLNGDAKLVVVNDDTTLADLRTTAPFDLRAAQQRASERGGAPARSAPNPISEFVFWARRPFHPSRLQNFLSTPLRGVFRSSGTFWVASRPEVAGVLDIAGTSVQTSSGGSWWASIPAAQRPKTPEFHAYIQETWHPAYGDRHQELSFVGLDLDVPKLRADLHDCLLTEAELSTPEEWQDLHHPFSWPEAS